MSTIEFISITVGIVSLGPGFWGIWFGLHERNRRLRFEVKIQSQFWSSLDRARYVIGDHLLIQELEQQLDHPEKHQLWNIHQAASDLYISLVEQYLSHVTTFTYDDLKRLCDNKFIYMRWQEKQWRYLICRRPENLSNAVPGYFIRSESRDQEPMDNTHIFFDMEKQKNMGLPNKTTECEMSL